MSKFRKKPIVIEAKQWFPGKHVEGVQYPPLPDTEQGKAYIATYGPCGIVQTLEGRMVAMPGDWIITGVKGEISPCKPDIFEETYDPVDGENGPAPHTVDEDFAHFLSYSGFGLTETDETIAKLKKAFEAAW